MSLETEYLHKFSPSLFCRLLILLEPIMDVSSSQNLTWKCPNIIHRKERPGEAERLQVLGVEFVWLTN